MPGARFFETPSSLPSRCAPDSSTANPAA
jgi:hypothetical protein